DPVDPVYCFKNQPARHYYRGGDKAELPADLAAAGLGVKILGPPTDPGMLSDMDAKAQYLCLVAESARLAPLRPFDSDWRTNQYPSDALYPFQARQLEELIHAVQPDALLAGAALADNTINNQSLVVLFTFAGKSLLFAGDAQWGNWESFLYGQDVSKLATPQLLPASKKMLGALNLYKVGHHGSTNATPMVAVEALRKGAVALCSTEPGCFGSAAKNSEVPRGPLLVELAKKGPVVRSDQVAAGDNSATDGLPKKLPAHFSSPGNQLYIDYEF
ncbi:MAG: MBL fold metallo-hydrolase, partial [Kiritimatiellaeota bacterium]|nr:MBL fold metallo-hydrolase [Kiritimatiellota bacterium]